MMVRGPGLAESMSRSLIDRIVAASNIELMTQTEIIALAGEAGAGLEKVRWRDRRTGAETEAPVRIRPQNGCRNAESRSTRRAS